MRNFNITLGLVFVTALVAACSPESTNLQSQRPFEVQQSERPVFPNIPEQKLEWITVDGGEGALDFNPNLDVLFITDNSESMKTAQANVIKNLQRFTRGITQYKMIDYHIGVMSVWDSKERAAEAPKFNPGNYGIGELRHIKDAKGQNYDQRYITRNESQLLGSTLDLGVASYQNGGPETEELFSPLAEALNKTGRGAANEGFFRDDSHLVVILLTDADDRSNGIDAQAMAQNLLRFKGGKSDKLSVYGVLVDKKDPETKKDYVLRVTPKDNPQCFEADGKKVLAECKKGLGPDRIEDMIVQANTKLNRSAEQIKSSNILRITDSKFGEKLGAIGDKITAETLRKEIALPNKPLMKDGVLYVKVFYGEQEIPYSAKRGWRLLNSQTIVLEGDISYEFQEGAKFRVEMIPLPNPTL